VITATYVVSLGEALESLKKMQAALDRQDRLTKELFEEWRDHHREFTRKMRESLDRQEKLLIQFRDTLVFG
jgi:hypothetical protein